MPNTFDIALGSTSKPRNLQFDVLDSMIDPGYGDDPGAGHYGSVAIDMRSCANVKVTVTGVTSAALATPLVGTAGTLVVWQAPTSPLLGGPSIPAYNGITGLNPRGFSILITVEPDGSGFAPSGVIGVSATAYGSFTGSCTIGVSGGVGSDFLTDTFHDANATVLTAHTPDYYPDGSGLGAIVGWHGMAAYSDNINSNVLQSSGNPGTVKFGRIFANRHDLMRVWVDVTRKRSNAGDVGAVVARANACAGNSDGSSGSHLELIWFFFQNQDASHIYLSWDRRHNYGAGFVVDEGEYQFTIIPLATGASIRLLMAFAGNQLFLFTADPGTGANPVLRRSITLATDWNDTSHEYVGYADIQFADAIEFTQLGALPLAAVAADNPGGVWESLGELAVGPETAWESLSQPAAEADTPWEALEALDAAADVPEESLAAVAAVASVPWDTTEGPWVLEPGGRGGWGPGAARGGGWQPRPGSGGSWR